MGGAQKRTGGFGSTEEVLASTSLDQARAVALQHARDNREFYGRYAEQELAWDVISADESGDHFDVRLSYRPLGNFRSAGIERLTISKDGSVGSRQIIRDPVFPIASSPPPSPWFS